MMPAESPNDCYQINSFCFHLPLTKHSLFLRDPTYMDPFHAKIVAAATGSTITALTSKSSDVGNANKQPTQLKNSDPVRRCQNQIADTTSSFSVSSAFPSTSSKLLLPDDQSSSHLCTRYLINCSSNFQRSCLPLGSRSSANRTSQWLPRCGEACLEGRGRTRALERGRDVIVRIPPFSKVTAFNEHYRWSGSSGYLLPLRTSSHTTIFSRFLSPQFFLPAP